MTVTPIHAAKIAGTQRAITDILRGQMCPYAESAARQVIDELRNLGWTPPGFRDDDVIPQPSTSSPGIRRMAVDATRAAVEAARERRKQPVSPPEDSATATDEGDER